MVIGKKKENIKVQKEEKSEPLPEKSDDEKWVRVKMIETGEVNGKQIDKGVILDVKEEDGSKLVEAKKAEIVEENIDGAAPIKKDEDKNKQDSIKSAEKTANYLGVNQKKVNKIKIIGKQLILIT